MKKPLFTQKIFFLIKNYSKALNRLLSLLIFLMFFCFEAIAQNPQVTVRFANPSYDCDNSTYYADVEFQADSPGYEIDAMNVRFWYNADQLQFNGLMDEFQPGYSVVVVPTTQNFFGAGAAWFGFPGNAIYANGAIQKTNPTQPSTLISTSEWTKLFRIGFDVTQTVIDPNFCPSLIWDLQEDPADGGFLPGSSGIYFLLIGGLETTENTSQFNWEYDGVTGTPHGAPLESECLSTTCSPPACTNLTDPLNGVTDVGVNTDVSWAAVADADGYYLSVGTTPGGTDIINTVNVQNFTTYEIGTMPYQTVIYVSVIPYNSFGQPNDCIEESFTTEEYFECTIPPDWAVTPSNYDFNGEITAKVLVDGIAVTGGTLAVFAGDECRGIATAVHFPSADHYIFSLLCYSNTGSGEMLTFKYMDPISCEVCDLTESIEFSPDMIIGDANSPHELNCLSEVPISIALNAGWSWFSVNVTGPDMSLTNVLSSIPLAYGDYIKNQTSSATFYGDSGWFGTLTEIDPREMYMIKLANAATLEFTGIPVDPNTTPIPINQGWTWIGYLPQVQMDITDALGSLTLASDDYIKSQINSATYYDAFDWFGTLNILSPFAGYKIKKSSADVLNYPEGGTSPREVIDMPFGTNFEDCTVNPSDYEFSGSITAQVLSGAEIIVSEGDKLLAYTGRECSGIANAKFFPGTGLYEFPLMVYSDVATGESLSFKYYDSKNDAVYDCVEKKSFSSDMVLSDAFEPLDLHIETTVLHTLEEEANQVPDITIYPNPFSNSTMLTYTLKTPSMVKISVYDLYGKLVEELNDSWQSTGKHKLKWEADNWPSGTFFIKMSTEKVTAVKKVILSK